MSEADPHWPTLSDLVVVASLVLLTDLLVVTSAGPGGPLRLALGVLFLGFLPGYALVAALFPRGSPGSTSRPADGRLNALSPRPTGPERFALSVGLSVAATGLVGLGLSFTPYEVRLVPVLAAISVLTLGAVVTAAVRRRRLPPRDRFAVPYADWIAAARDAVGVSAATGRRDRALNGFVLVCLLLAASGAAYTVLPPEEGFTEFYLLDRTANGELTAEQYPTEFDAGEPRSLAVGVRNSGEKPRTYTVAVQLQRLDARNGQTRVIDREDLDRFRVTAGPNETVVRNHTVAPGMTGTNLRLTYLLYRGRAPADPTVETAHREVHLMINVSRPHESVSPLAVREYRMSLTGRT